MKKKKIFTSESIKPSQNHRSVACPLLPFDRGATGQASPQRVAMWKSEKVKWQNVIQTSQALNIFKTHIAAVFTVACVDKSRAPRVSALKKNLLKAGGGNVSRPVPATSFPGW